VFSAAKANYSLTASFGIRTATSMLDSRGHRVYQYVNSNNHIFWCSCNCRINGKNILIRGAGWAPDLFQRTDAKRQETEIHYPNAPVNV
jgi:hypothetical protein